MAVRVMAWNLENFGATTERYRRVKGTDSYLLAQFVADVVVAWNVDVLAVMEVLPTAKRSLDNVLHALVARTGNQKWMYDWIPGGLKVIARGGTEDSVKSIDDLAWGGGASSPRQEGYAVFWRDDDNRRFTMLSPPKFISFGAQWVGRERKSPPRYAICLSLSGRKEKTADPGAGKGASGVAPQGPFDPNRPGTGWEPSYYPEVSTKTNPDAANWELVRRPAYFVLKAGAGDDRGTVWPIQVFHAPSNPGLAMRATAKAALGRELYVMQRVEKNRAIGALTYHDKASAAGDYNLDVAATNQGPWNATSYYWKSFADNGAALGNVCNRPGIGKSSATAIKLRQGRQQILKPNIADYYGGPIDNSFVRGFPNCVQLVAPLLTEVCTRGRLNGDPVARFLDVLITAKLGMDALDPNDRGPCKGGRPLIPDICNWSHFYDGVIQGYFDGSDWNQGTGGARSAAQLIRTFVSDHLPVLMEFPA